MRFTRSILIGSTLALVGFTSACDDGLTEINKNPNEPEVVAPQYVLADAQTSAIGHDFGTHGVWFGLYLNDIWPQHLAQIQYNDEDKYILRPNVLNSFWNNQYSGPLTNLRVLKEDAEGVPNQAAVADILSQYIYLALTDHYGPIPYSEALQGEGGQIAPTYDSQETVYNGMLATLASAQASIQVGGATPFEAGDLIYGGDMDRWRKFANSLRMRMAMRIADVNAGKAQTEFLAALQAGGFESNADNALLVWGSAINAQNAHYDYQVNQNRNDFVVSATLVDTLASLADPRLPIFVQPAASDGEYRGLVNGMVPAEYEPKRILADFSYIGEYFLKPNSPSIIMTYSELLFLKAEAAARGWAVGGTPEELYVQAITASLQQYGVSAAEISAYLAQTRVAPSSNPATLLQQIYLQKWIGLYMNGPEAYAEVRRTDSPALALAANHDIDAFPTRATYPSDEQNLNKAGYDAGVAALGGSDALTTRLWWDVR